MLKSTGAKGGDIFLLTDGGEEVLAQQGYAYEIFDKVKANPAVTTVKAGVTDSGCC